MPDEPVEDAGAVVPPPIEIANDQAKAAWAAVREARRGINVAWFSVFVNLAVVIVALAAPYIQQSIARQEQIQRHDEIKTAIFESMEESTRTFQLPEPLPAPDNADDPAYPELIDFSIDRASHMISSPKGRVKI